jgi:hypothetical protein
MKLTAPVLNAGHASLDRDAGTKLDPYLRLIFNLVLPQGETRCEWKKQP